jgi:septal ring factor EnvC (AmiA/AmiB activator)
MSTRHSLLERQLARSGITNPDAPPPSAEAWAELLEQVNAAYTQADQDRYRLERSLSVSTSEMQEEINAREQAQTALEEVRKNLETQNAHLERVNGWFRTIMEQMMLTVRRGASSNEVLDQLRIMQYEFRQLDQKRNGS